MKKIYYLATFTIFSMSFAFAETTSENPISNFIGDTLNYLVYQLWLFLSTNSLLY